MDFKILYVIIIRFTNIYVYPILNSPSASGCRKGAEKSNDELKAIIDGTRVMIVMDNASGGL